MGVAGAALWTLCALVAASLLTAALEPVVIGGRERGPARLLRYCTEASPATRDPWLHAAAPVVALLATAWGMVVIPLDRHLVGADVGIGLFYFIVVVDFTVVAIAMGGWGANTTAAVESCYRAVAQLVAYVVPLGLAILGPVLMARSLSTVAIIEAQREASLWYVVAQPQGLLLYVATALMQVYRAPFLEPFADRLEGGVLSTTGGWKALVWRVSLSGLLFLAAAMGAVLFLGGYAGPWLPGYAWMAIKSFALLVVMLVAGRLVRPLSTAQMLALSWKVLIPLGLVHVLVVGGLVLLGVGQNAFQQ